MRVSIYLYIYIYTLCAHSPHAHIYGGFLNWGYPQSIQVRVNHFGIETTMVTLGFTKVKGPTLVSFGRRLPENPPFSSLILAARKFHLARGFPSPCWIITPGTDGGETSFSWSTTVSSAPWLAGTSPPTNGVFSLGN